MGSLCSTQKLETNYTFVWTSSLSCPYLASDSKQFNLFLNQIQYCWKHVKGHQQPTTCMFLGIGYP
jgi:hypothetical protein